MEGLTIESKQRERAKQFRDFARNVTNAKTRNAYVGTRIRKTNIFKVSKRLI